MLIRVGGGNLAIGVCVMCVCMCVCVVCVCVCVMHACAHINECIQVYVYMWYKVRHHALSSPYHPQKGQPWPI